MPRTRSLAWSELKIGVLTIVALVIAALAIFLVTGGSGFFWQRYSLKARFPSVAGLKPGSPVRLAGIEVGSVTDTPLAGDQVEVVFEVNRAYGDRITTESVATLGSVSLLGESAVDITPSQRGTPIPEWGYVPPGRTPVQLADVTNQASEGIGELTGLLQDMRQGRGTIGKLMTDERLYAELQQFVASAGELTRGIRDGQGTLGKLVTDPATANALEASLTNVEQITARINAGEGSLGRLLKDDDFANSLTGATNNIQELTGKINRGEGTMGKLFTDDRVFKQLDSATRQLDELLARLNAGEGTAGQLLKDEQLYENMNAATTELRDLLSEIKKDPKRYLNVRISIF
ncbi:MAG TPA: MlaD family protein [Vicinamibacterales bacterium]|jgi:phospholipid/cholesterol/gamma-HCH transport system substrate-binding protein|nr:MlaD family protein [Vicinamibacterales bacterium]